MGGDSGKRLDWLRLPDKRGGGLALIGRHIVPALLLLILLLVQLLLPSLVFVFPFLLLFLLPVLFQNDERGLLQVGD